MDAETIEHPADRGLDGWVQLVYADTGEPITAAVGHQKDLAGLLEERRVVLRATFVHNDRWNEYHRLEDADEKASRKARKARADAAAASSKAADLATAADRAEAEADQAAEAASIADGRRHSLARSNRAAEAALSAREAATAASSKAADLATAADRAEAEATELAQRRAALLAEGKAADEGLVSRTFRRAASRSAYLGTHTREILTAEQRKLLTGKP